MVIPASSTEYIAVTVTTSPAGVGLTDNPPQFAFLPETSRGNPAPGGWLTGQWDGAVTARILVGPSGGTTALTRGDWHVWIKIDPPNDELVVRNTGTLHVT